jgi:hypothetical protein
MSEKKATRTGGTAKRAALCFVLGMLCAAGAAAEGLRNITVVNVDTYFDGSYRISIEDVFLARLFPGFSLQLKAARFDTPGFYMHVFSAGPVINFTEALYLDALYGLGFDPEWRFHHRGELNLNYETDEITLSIGARFAYFPDAGYFFVIPSLGAKILLAPWAALFNKLFLSWDSHNFFSGSYWGELHWITGETVTIRTGGTVSWANELGYSLLVGIDLRFSPAVLLRYYFQFLSNTIDYGDAPAAVFGIENGLFLDVKF